MKYCFLALFITVFFVSCDGWKEVYTSTLDNDWSISIEKQAKNEAAGPYWPCRLHLFLPNGIKYETLYGYCTLSSFIGSYDYSFYSPGYRLEIAGSGTSDHYVLTMHVNNDAKGYSTPWPEEGDFFQSLLDFE